MTQDEIIEMARQAGAIPVHKDPKNKALVGNGNIEAFAKLVAAKKREICNTYVKELQELVKLIRLDEREACAKIGDLFHDKNANCGDLIRARGEA